jgi:tetratricopeptide (TPR) repeat protein
MPAWFMPFALLFLANLALLVYCNSLHGEFVLDNALVILRDKRLQGLNWGNLHQIWTQNYWYPNFPSNLFRPLTTTTYALNWAGFTSQPPVFGFHVFNLVLHACNAGLVLVIARRLSGRAWFAAIAAAMFAVHPVETESVSNIVGRADELATFWILVGFWCYLRSAWTFGWARFGWLAGVGLAAFPAEFSKETGFLLLGIMLLYDLLFRWPKLTGSFFRRLGTAACEFGLKGYTAVVPAIATFLIVWHHYILDPSPLYGELFIDNPIARPPSWLSGELTACKVLGRYLALLVYPRTLSMDYSFNQIPLYGMNSTPWEDAQCWIGLAVVAVLLGMAFWFRRRQPLFSFGVLFFFGTIALTANVFFPIGSIMGERFLYLPSIGYCFVASLALCLLGGTMAVGATRPGGWRGPAALAISALLLAGYGVRTYARNYDWTTDFTMWQSAVESAPNSFKVHKGLSNVFWNRVNKHYDSEGRPVDPGLSERDREIGLDEAIVSAEIGLAILDRSPLSIERQDNTLFCDLGMYYYLKGRFLDERNDPGAAVFYRKGVEIMLRAKAVDTYVNGASRKAQLERGRSPDSIADVGNPRVHTQLAESYLGLREWKEAAAAAAYSIHLSPVPDNAYEIYWILATAQANGGQFKDAAITYLRLLIILKATQSPQDESLLYQNLESIYTNPAAFNLPRNQAVIERNAATGADWQLVGSNPLVWEQFIQANANVVQSLIDAKQFNAARQFRRIAVNARGNGGYGCPEDRIPVVPKTP